MKTTKRTTTPSPTRPAATPRRATRSTPAAPRTPRRVATKPTPTADDIALRAYEIFLGRNGDGGDATADWLQAERELMTPASKPRRRSGAAA